MCRAQQAFHHDRSAAAQLDNVRIVAAQAAAAWGHEAVAAERREARLDRRAGEFALTAEEMRPGEDEGDGAAFNENPDRGHADV
jgi:hypothetical protein